MKVNKLLNIGNYYLIICGNKMKIKFLENVKFCNLMLFICLCFDKIYCKKVSCCLY